MSATPTLDELREEWAAPDDMAANEPHYDGCWANHAGCAVIAALDHAYALARELVELRQKYERKATP